jgi:hypothetical protein
MQNPPKFESLDARKGGIPIAHHCYREEVLMWTHLFEVLFTGAAIFALFPLAVIAALAEKWNPISKVRATQPLIKEPLMWGPSPKMPGLRVEEISLNIDNDAGTAITRFNGDLKMLDFCATT